MYESFFNLSKKPFSLLPDAKFLYLSKNHNSALTMLRYGMESRAFITVITGDIGCGKTTLCRKLLEEVSSDVTIGLITNTHSAFGDPLKWVLLAFDLEYREKTKVEQYQTLVDFMIDEYAQNRYTVLIVDEAQNLNDTALEELRMLSNINADEHQILQLVLVGQPQLRDALRRPELTQFAQRVSADYHIQPLDLEETTSYIKHRLQVVDGDPDIFEHKTYPLIHAHSKGVPRLINILCDTALVYAYGAKQYNIDKDLIREVIKDREKGVYFNSVHTESAPVSPASKEVEDKKARAAKASAEKPRMDSAFRRLDTTNVRPPEPKVEQKKTKRPKEIETRPSLNQNKRANDRDKISDTDIRWTNEQLKNLDREVKPTEFDEVPKANSKRKRGKERKKNPVRREPASIPVPERHREAKKQFLDMKAKLEEPQNRKKLYSIAAIFILLAGVYFSQNATMFASLFSQDEQSKISAWLDEAGGYQKALVSDPTNAEAMTGILAIKDEILAQSSAAQKEENWDLARTRLQTLMQIEPQSEKGLAALRSVDEAEEMALAVAAERAAAAAREEIQAWLNQAEQYVKEEKLVNPEGENAYFLYAKVLESDASNEAAQEGLKSLKRTLLTISSAAEANGDWKVGRTLLQSWLVFEPSNSEAQNALNVLEEMERLERQKAQKEEEVQDSLDEAESLLALEQMTEPDAVVAHKLFEEVLERDPNNVRAQSGLLAIIDKLISAANKAQADGDWRTARSQLRAVLKIEPRNERGQQGIADLTAAESASVAASERESTIEDWMETANTYLNKGQLVNPAGENAYELLTKILELDPDNSAAKTKVEALKGTLLLNAKTAREAGKWDLARNQYKDLASIEPKSDAATQGLLAVDEGEAEAAQAASQAELQDWLDDAKKYQENGDLLGSDEANAYHVFGKVLAREADHPEALAGIQSIKESLYTASQTARSEESWELARSHLLALQEIEPENDRAQQSLAEVDKEEEAAATLTQIQAWLDEANNYLDKGQLIEPLKENAYASLQKILGIDPDNGAALAGVARIKDSLLSMALRAQEEQEWDLARARLRALLSIAPESESGQKALVSLDGLQAAAAVQAEIQSWLSKSNDFLDKGRLVEPKQANAYYLLEKVLAYEPGNTVALAGIEKIKDQLFEIAAKEQNEQNWRLAQTRLESVLRIDSNNQQAQQAISDLNDAELAANEQAELQNWLAQANSFLDKEQFIEPPKANAYDLLSKVLEREPDNETAKTGIETIKEALLLGATQAEARQNWELARTLLQDLLRIEPKSDRGQLALKKLDATEQTAISQVTAQAQIQDWLDQSGAYIKSGQLVVPAGENAYDLLRKVLTQDPTNTEALAGVASIKDTLYTLATKAQAKQEWNSARSVLQALLKIEPQSDRSRKALVALAEAEDLATTQAKSEEEIQILLRRAEKYIAGGQLVAPVINNAYEVLTKVLQRKPDSIPAQAKMAELKDTLFAAARAAQAQGEWDQARRQLKTLLLIDPQSRRGQQALAALSEAEFIDREKAQQSDEIQRWLSEADEYLKSPQLLEPTVSNVLGILQQVLIRDPENIAAKSRIATLKDRLFLSASLAQAEGDLGLARTQLQALLRMEPNSERVLKEIEALSLIEQEGRTAITRSENPGAIRTQAQEPASENEGSAPSLGQEIFDFLMRGGEE